MQEHPSDSKQQHIESLRVEVQQILSDLLPIAYHELGKHCIQNKQHLEDVPDLLSDLKKVLSELRKMRLSGEDEQPIEHQAMGIPTPYLLACDQRNSIVAKIGLVVYQKFQEESGPRHIVYEIKKHLIRLETLNDELQKSLETQQKSIKRKPDVQSQGAIVHRHPKVIGSPSMVLSNRSIQFDSGTSSFPRVRKSVRSTKKRLMISAVAVLLVFFAFAIVSPTRSNPNKISRDNGAQEVAPANSPKASSLQGDRLQSSSQSNKVGNSREGRSLLSSDKSEESTTAQSNILQLAPFFSNKVESEPNESWDIEKTISFAQPYPSGEIFLLSQDRFAYCANNYPLRICDIATNREIKIFDDPGIPYKDIRKIESIKSLIWCTDFKKDAGSTFVAWNYESDTLQTSLPVESPMDKVPPALEGSFSQDGKLIATVPKYHGNDSSATIRVWDAMGQSKLYQTMGANPVAFSPDGSLLAFRHYKKTGSDGCVLWDFRNDKILSVLRRPENRSKYGKVSQLGFIPNTPLLAVVWSDPGYLIELWNWQTHKLAVVFELKHEDIREDIAHLAVAANGEFLVTGGKSLVLWHLPSGGRIARLDTGDRFVNSISISPDGNRIAAAVEDKQAIFWTRQSNAKGRFAFSKQAFQFAGDPVARNITGPNGEKVMIGGDGLKSDWYYHYFIDASGKVVKHGKARVQSDGSSIRESTYRNGELVDRQEYDSKKRLIASYKRQQDGNFVVDEIYTDSSGNEIQFRSIDRITTKVSGESVESIRPRVRINEDNVSLPAGGRILVASVNTANIESMPWWLKENNASISSLKCAATDDSLIIDFDVDDSQWRKMQIVYPLLIRLFDRNGRYLTHFVTSEGFTVFPSIFTHLDGNRKSFLKQKNSFEADRNKVYLLSPKSNRLIYGVNVRDLRDASMVEVGFTER